MTEREDCRAYNNWKTQMSVKINEYVDVRQRSEALGVKAPEGFCILPQGFDTADKVSNLRHEAAALDLKALFRNTEVPITVYQPDGTEIPYLQQNDITWAGPVLLFGAAILTEHPGLVNVSLGVIANYLSELFKGTREPTRATLSVVIETVSTKTSKKITKRYDFDGPPEKIHDIAKIIKDTQ